MRSDKSDKSSRSAGITEIHWEADSRDRVMRDGKSGGRPSREEYGGGRERVTTSEERVLRWGNQIRLYR